MWKLNLSLEGRGYDFSSPLLCTRGIQEELNEVEIHSIITQIREAVAEHGTIDYLQVFESTHRPTHEKIYVIDSCAVADRKKLQESPEELEHDMIEYDHTTILFNHEY